MRFGTQTGLCAHVFRLLRKTRVPWVLLENVPGLLNWHMRDDPPQPPAISHVVSELEKLGYRWAHRVVGLTGFGIPQRRRRVFILASVHGDPRDVLLAPQAVCLGQCVEMHRRGEASMRDDVVGGFDQDDDSPRDDETAKGEIERRAVSRDECVCVECALDAVASSATARGEGGGFDRALSACAHGARECYECFRTPPFVTPKRTVASIDLAEKRHGPMLDELFTLTTANGRRMCVVERRENGEGRRGMLHVEDAERLMGLPAGWTEPAYPLNVPGKPKRNIDYGYAALLAKNGRPRTNGAEEDDGDGDARAENARRAFAAQMNEFAAATFKRFEKLGLAVAVPQARWLGERLMRPYDLKFSRAGDGVKFAVAVPGGPNAANGGVLDRRDRRVRRASPSSDDGGPFGIDEGTLDDPGTENATVSRSGARRRTLSNAPNQLVSDARLEAAAAASGWPDAAYNVRPALSWRGRFALSDCGDAPVIRGFVPLGEFLRKKVEDMQECPLEQALGYVKRLRLAHVEIEPFVARALGEKPKGSAKARVPAGDGVPGTAEGIPGDVRCDASLETPLDVDADGGVPGNGVPAGRVVWAPWLLGRGPPARRARVYWPALALHAHDDRDQIPPDAFTELLAKQRKGGPNGRVPSSETQTTITSDTHVLVVYFGDKTYEWCESDALLNFLEHRDELADQPLLRNRARFLRGVDLAAEWHAEQRRLGVTPSMRRAQEARARAEERLRRAVGAASGDGNHAAMPPASCGVCRVCSRKAEAETSIPFSSRHLARACVVANTKATKEAKAKAKTSGVAASLCPQISAIIEARRGHVGACLTLLRERAVGRRVRVRWPDETERGPFAGTVASFDAESLTHAIAYDDGDIEPACRLWKETVHLGVPEDAHAEAERAERRDRGDGKDDAAFLRTENGTAAAAAAARASSSFGKRKRGAGDEADRDGPRRDPRAARVSARARIAERETDRARQRERPRRGPGRPPSAGRGRGGRGGRGGGGGGGARGRKEACVVG